MDKEFIGEYTHSVDDKGRLVLPTKFRRQLADGGVVTRGFDGCLFLFTKKDWQDLIKKLRTLPLSGRVARDFNRFLVAPAMEVKPDRQGRILFPAYLRMDANLKTSVVVAGVINRIEIWNSQAWKEYRTKVNKQADDIAEKLRDQGIQV